MSDKSIQYDHCPFCGVSIKNKKLPNHLAEHCDGT